MRKITSLLMLFCMFVGTAWAQDPIAGVKEIPTDAIDFSTSKLETGYYLIKQTNTADKTGFLKATSESAGAEVAATEGLVANKPGQATYVWYVEVADDGKFSVSTANKVAAWQAPTQQQKNLVAYASRATTLELETTFASLTSPTQTLVKAYWEEQECYSYVHASANKLGSWNDQNTASLFYLEFYRIADANLLYAADKSALEAKILEYKSTLGRIDLQTSDSEGAFYLSAPTDADGNTIDKMIDGKADTFYGSTWGAAVGYFHYWQVDLVDASALPEFEFAYITRANGSDSPTKIVVKGSEDGDEFTEIASLTGLPTNGGESYRSAKVDNSKGYLHIRFEVPSTKNNYHPGKDQPEVTIALAEFALFKTEANYSDVDKYILSLVKEAQEVVDDEDATQAEVNAALAALTNALESTVKYSFQYEGVEKYTQETKAAYGQVYPAYTVQLPYGISAEAQTGSVQIDECGKVVTKTVELKKTADTPFESYASVNDVQKWYYVQVHANKNYQYYVKHANDMLKWNGQKSAPASELDEHLWAFVGDVFGMKFVNKKSGQVLTFAENGTVSMSDEGTKLVITDSDAKSPWFCFKYPTNGNYVNADVNRQDGALSSWTDNDAGSSFKVTLCEEMEVVVKEVGYATLFKNSPVIIPETVEAYVVEEVASNSAKLQPVEGTLPANTGVILKGAGTHKFITSADVAATIESNLLSGTVEAKEVAGPAYVLASINNVTGFYAAKLTGGKFVNNAGKAYLPAPTDAAARFITFDFGTETAIDELNGENGNVKTVIYDLSGRRVQKVQKGIFIVNGKVVIK